MCVSLPRPKIEAEAITGSEGLLTTCIDEEPKGSGAPLAYGILHGPHQRLGSRGPRHLCVLSNSEQRSRGD